MDDGAIMMSSQMEMRNMLLETRRKADPCYKVTKNLAVLCSCFRVLWKVELVSNETGYLIDKTSEQMLRIWLSLLLNAYSKCEKRKMT